MHQTTILLTSQQSSPTIQIGRPNFVDLVDTDMHERGFPPFEIGQLIKQIHSVSNHDKKLPVPEFCGENNGDAFMDRFSKWKLFWIIRIRETQGGNNSYRNQPKGSTSYNNTYDKAFKESIHGLK